MPDIDNLTPEQYCADVASATLEHLAALGGELESLEIGFAQLGAFLLNQARTEVDETKEEQAFNLAGIASVISLINSDAAKNMVRDLASKLPIRGIDYGIGIEGN